MRKSDAPADAVRGMMSAMPFRLTPIAPVLLGVVSAQVALGVMTPLIPILLLQDAVPTSLIGLVASAYFLGFLAGALTVDRIVARVGHIRAFAAVAAVAADAALLLALTRSPWVWAALRLIIGYAMSGLFLVAESWLNDKADTTTRGRTFGAYLVASWGGSAAGPLALNLVHGSSLLFVAVGMAFATSLLPMALTQQTNPTLGPRTQFGLVRLFRISPLGVVCCFASGLTNSSFYALIPVYLNRHGYDAGTVAAFISAAMVAGLAVQYPIGLLSDSLGRRPVTLGALILGFGFAAILGLAGSAPFLVLTAIGCLFAGVAAPLYGLGAGQTNDHLDRADFVGASGGLLFAWSLGASIGPTVAGATMGWLGPSGLFAYLTMVLGTVGLFTFARMTLRAGVPRGLQSTFVPGPAAPPRLAELAPRSAPSTSAAPIDAVLDSGSPSAGKG